MKLAGKVAIVTGGSQGIGEAIALRYAKEGARVAIVYHRNDATAQAVVDRIAAAGGTAVAIKADCAKVPDIERMVGEVLSQFGTVDILVNNAGVFRTVPVEETTEEIWDEQLDLNLRGAFFCVKTLVPIFRKNGGGKVINVTSIAGVGAFPNCPAYCASKGRARDPDQGAGGGTWDGSISTSIRSGRGTSRRRSTRICAGPAMTTTSR